MVSTGVHFSLRIFQPLFSNLSEDDAALVAEAVNQAAEP